MKKKNITRSVLSLLLVALLGLSVTGCGKAQAPTLTDENTNAEASASARPSDTPAEEIPAANTPASDSSSAVQPSSALPVKALHPKQVEENPYMAKSDANIHHDGYNTDSTDEILPLGIYPEINVSYETTNANASPAIYFDSYGHAVVPLLGGIAIRDLNAEETQTLGYFSPKQHDGGEYIIQSSYTFLDSENRIVCPTSNNHVLMLRTTDEDGNVLPEFEKVLDIDIKAAFCLLFLIMKEISGLPPVASGFILSVNSRVWSVTLITKPLIRSWTVGRQICQKPYTSMS